MEQYMVEARLWLANQLGLIVNEMIDYGYRPSNDDGYRFLLQKSGLLIIALQERLEKKQ